MNSTNDAARLRKLVYALLITVAVGAAAGRILGVESVWEPSLHPGKPGEKALRGNWPSERPPALPTFSSNDRSRWAMIRALVDHGTFVIGKRDETRTTERRGKTLKYRDHCTWDREKWESGWDTVDKVLNPNTKKFYSTKPPLYPTLVAALYWLLQLLTGWTLAANIWEVVKSILLLVNVLPFAIYLLLIARLVERFGRNDWSKIFVVAFACFGTFVTPFLITLTNHTAGTFSAMFALYPALCILTRSAGEEKTQPTWYFFPIAGIFAAFAACNELPALAFTAGLGLVLLIHSPKKTLLFFVPAAALTLAAFIIVNYIAVGEVLPIYFKKHMDTIWYEYAGSHWAKPPGSTGIDFAKYHESRLSYAFHFLLGHHGLFSLTPVWLLAFAGMFFGLIRPKNAAGCDALPRYFFGMSLLLSLIIIGFYLWRSDNYSGWSCCLRWLMWLTPIWLLCLLPVLDRLANSRPGRWVAYAALALSVMSVSFPAWNPWRHPWIFRWMDANQWIPY